jgi:hypothetical protein
MLSVLAAGALVTSCFGGGSPADLLLERGEGRPVLSGPEQSVDSDDGFFTVHWTEEGPDRPGEMTDADGSGLPDAIDRILVGLQTAKQAYEQAGYRPVNHDEFGGETSGLDVYVHEIDAFGYAHPLAVGAGKSCFIELDPQLQALGAGAAESVAAHELHHCVQYAYTTASHPWIYEASATFEQYRLFSGPALDAALALLWNQRLRGADRLLSTRGDRFEYSGFVFLKFWSEFGDADHSAVVALWERLAENSVWKEAVNLESQSRWNRPFGELVLDLSIWKLFACSRDDGQHFAPATHPCVLPAVSVSLEPLEPEADGLTWAFAETPFTAMFGEIEVPASDQELSVDCDVSPAGARVGLALTAVDSYGLGGGVARGFVDAGQPLSVTLDASLDPYGSVGFIVVSLGEQAAEIECEWTWEDRPPNPADPADCVCGSGSAPRRGLSLGSLLLLTLVFARLRWRRA